MAKRIIGTAEEAKQWIMESSIEEVHKNALNQFITKFSSLNFYRKERPETDPVWLKNLGQVFIGVDSDNLLWYQFDHFDHSEYDDYKYQDSFYNYQGFARDIGEYTEIFLDGEPLLIIAAVIENLDSILAVKGGGSEDMTVYDFSYDDIERLGDGKGELSPDSANQAFANYVMMLDHVSAVMFSEDNIVEANE